MSGSGTEELTEIIVELGYGSTKEEVQEMNFFEVMEYATRLIEDDVVDSGRWTVYHRAILDYGGKLFAIDYGVGATEMQEHDEDYYVKRVYPKSVTTIIYE